MSEHTPGPWKIERQKRSKEGFARPLFIFSENPLPGHGDTVCLLGSGFVNYANSEENARRIVHCVNHHDELVEALEYIYHDVKQGAIPNPDDPWYEKARAVLEKVKR